MTLGWNRLGGLEFAMLLMKIENFFSCCSVNMRSVRSNVDKVSAVDLDVLCEPRTTMEKSSCNFDTKNQTN